MALFSSNFSGVRVSGRRERGKRREAVASGRLYVVLDEPHDDGRLELALVTGSGEEARFPVPPATTKAPLRFAVGWPTHRSSVWRLWANPNKDDVYLSTRQSAGEFKFSLHESGDWRMQWVRDRPPDRTRTAWHGEEPKGRILDQWHRPAPDGTGWTFTISLWVRPEDVTDIPGDTVRGDDTQWLDPLQTDSPRSSSSSSRDPPAWRST